MTKLLQKRALRGCGRKNFTNNFISGGGVRAAAAQILLAAGGAGAQAV